MKKSFIGIDIGVNGGIAIIEEGKLVFTATIPKVQNKVDVHELNRLLSSFKSRSEEQYVVIEDLHSIFGTGAKSNFQFGWINGIIEAILISNGYSFEKIQPKKWQETCWQGIRPILINTGKKKKNGEVKYKVDTKGTSLLAAKRLYPKADFSISERAKKQHDGIVDSVLLSYYGYLKFK